MRSPTCTVGWFTPAAVTRRSAAPAITVLVGPAALSVGAGSGWSPVTVAVFARVVPAAEARTVPAIVTVAVAPLASVPTVQETVCPAVEQEPWLAVTVPGFRPAGSGSLSVTPVAVDGPSLRTVSV